MTRLTSRRGTRYTKGSSNGWAGLPAALRVCDRCGQPVTLQESSREHTDVHEGRTVGFFVRHTRCGP